MNKLESLTYLLNKGLNIHKFEVVTEEKQLVDAINKFKIVSIRFDNDKGDLQLPFTTIEGNNWDITDIINIRNKMIETDAYLIVSNGRYYDRYMKHNIVVRVETNGEFRCELSSFRVPLRNMYDYPSNHPLTALVGDICEPTYRWTIYGDRICNLMEMKRLILDIYAKGLYNKWIECTTYTEKVGMLNEPIVYWHIC